MRVLSVMGVAGVVWASCLGAVAQGAAAPEVIFVHGRILTGAHLRPGDPDAVPARVSAMAVRGGVVVAVGGDAEIRRLGGAGTQVVDLRGRFAMPGFDDAHVHLWSAGAQKALTVDLDHVASLAAMQERIRAYVAAHAVEPGMWIQGAGWDHTLWAGKRLPTRGDLDGVTAGHPAIFYRTDGHILVANSAALLAAGITRATADPAGAKIDRDADGEATGILREAAAMRLVEEKIPPPTADQRRLALRTAMEDALEHGVTTVQDYSPDPENFRTMEAMEAGHELRLRVVEWIDFDLPVAELERRRASHPADDPMLRYGMLKGFMDGSLGSRTAALAAPYSDDAGNTGIPRYGQEKLNAMAEERAAAGFQMGFHAIGDRANHMALDAFAHAEKVGDKDAAGAASSLPRSRRFRIEHAQVLLPADFARFRELGVIASMQPSHLLTDMEWAGARLGEDRAQYAYAWKTFLDDGVVLAFGTDYPVESVDPFRGLYAATTRRNEAGTKTFHPEERIPLSEAIYAYTQASAFAAFRERELGRLEPGYLADFVVLDRDPTRCTPAELLHTRVLRTVVGGQTVYRADERRQAAH